MTEQELIEFLKDNLVLEYTGDDRSSYYPSITLNLCGEEISSISLYGLETS